VVLLGLVRSREEAARARALAERAKGVKAVTEQLEVVDRRRGDDHPGRGLFRRPTRKGA
jgi:hypothetical protein